MKAGDRVIYIPYHAYGDRTHPDCERGRISSFNSKGEPFVRFDKQVTRLGWDGATSQACNLDTIVLEKEI